MTAIATTVARIRKTGSPYLELIASEVWDADEALLDAFIAEAEQDEGEIGRLCRTRSPRSAAAWAVLQAMREEA